MPVELLEHITITTDPSIVEADEAQQTGYTESLSTVFQESVAFATPIEGQADLIGIFFFYIKKTNNS